MDPVLIIGAIIALALLARRAPAAMPAGGGGSGGSGTFDVIGAPVIPPGVPFPPGPGMMIPAPPPPSEFTAHIEVCPPYCGGSGIPTVPVIGATSPAPAGGLLGYPTSDYLPEGPAGGSVLLSAADPRVIYRAAAGRG